MTLISLPIYLKVKIENIFYSYYIINKLGKNLVNISLHQTGPKDYILEIKPKGSWQPDLN